VHHPSPTGLWQPALYLTDSERQGESNKVPQKPIQCNGRDGYPAEKPPSPRASSGGRTRTWKGRGESRRLRKQGKRGRTLRKIELQSQEIFRAHPLERGGFRRQWGTGLGKKQGTNTKRRRRCLSLRTHPQVSPPQIFTERGPFLYGSALHDLQPAHSAFRKATRWGRPPGERKRSRRIFLKTVNTTI